MSKNPGSAGERRVGSGGVAGSPDLADPEASPKSPAAGESPPQALSLEERQRRLWPRPTQSQKADPKRSAPPVFTDADHIYLINTIENFASGSSEERRFLDAGASRGTAIFGHRHPVIDAAIHAQLERIAGAAWEEACLLPTIDLASALVDRAPERMERCFFAASGAAAMEVALRAAVADARIARPEIKSGHEILYLETRKLDSELSPGESLVESVRLPDGVRAVPLQGPHCGKCPWGKKRESCRLECASSLRAEIEKHKSTAVALVLEPRVQGDSVIVHPEGYAKSARDACREAGLLLVADESATAFGWTGKIFASLAERADPDILVASRALTSGYLPLGAVLLAGDIAARLEEHPAEVRLLGGIPAGEGNALACAAALGCLQVFDAESSLSNVPVLAAVAQRELDLIRFGKDVVDIRQHGLMIGIELQGSPAPVLAAAFDLGVWLEASGQTLMLRPPATTAQWELRWLIDRVAQAVARGEASHA